MAHKRAERVSEAIKREISVIILQELKDPDVLNVTVTDVETSDDLRHAKVFVSIMGDEDVKEQSMKGLHRAQGFLRSEVSHRLRLRYAPELQFKLDRSIDRAMRIEEILNDLKSRSGKTADPGSGGSPTDGTSP